LSMTFIGLIVALFTPIEQYETFLYAIGSVFGPLFAIVLSDYFLFHRRTIEQSLRLHVGTTVVWVIGVFLYYQFQTMNLPLGTTLPTMLATAVLFCISKKFLEQWTWSVK